MCAAELKNRPGDGQFTVASRWVWTTLLALLHTVDIHTCFRYSGKGRYGLFH